MASTAIAFSDFSIHRSAILSAERDIAEAEKFGVAQALWMIHQHEKPCLLRENLGFGSPDLLEDAI